MALRILVVGFGVLALACGGGEGADGERTSGPASGSEGVRSEARPARGGPARTERPGPTSAPDSVASPEANADSGVPRILFFGTSLTAGYGLADPDSAFPARIQSRIDSAGLDYRVVEAGVPGETSAAGVRRIGWAMDDRPIDVVVVELGGNDVLRGLAPEALQENLAAVVDSVRARRPGATVVLAGMRAPPNLGPRYEEGLRNAYREVARSEDVTLLPFLLEGVAGRPELNQDDGIHPNARGHRRIARNLWKVLEPLLTVRSRSAER